MIDTQLHDYVTTTRRYAFFNFRNAEACDELAQNRLISSEICLENNHKIGRFLPIAFWWSLPRKLPRNYREIDRFFANLSLKIPRNLTFSSATCQKPCNLLLNRRKSLLYFFLVAFNIKYVNPFILV